MRTQVLLVDPAPDSMLRGKALLLLGSTSAIFAEWSDSVTHFEEAASILGQHFVDQGE